MTLKRVQRKFKTGECTSLPRKSQFNDVLQSELIKTKKINLSEA